jgi:hypothetical protein
MSEGNRSRWVKYEGRAVWKPAAVMDSVVRTALSRNGTLLPLRITVSRAATKSDMTASASFRPASTAMMSELGLVYFLVRAASRNTVKVWPVSQRLYGESGFSYLQCDLV